MFRYIKLYKVYLSRAIKCRLEYKKDAIIGIFSFLLTNTISFLSLMFIVRSIPSLNGWTTYELGFLYGFSMIPRAIDHLLTDSLWYIGYWYVKNGIVDRFLIRPVNVLFQVIAEVFQPEAIGELLIGVALFVWCGSRITIHWSFTNVLLLVIASIFGAIIFTAIKLITCSVAFWTKRSGQLMSTAYNFADFSKYPIKIYHPAIRFIMTFILPFGLVISIPMETVIKGGYNSLTISAAIILVSFLLSAIGYFIWCQGLKRYESSGS